AGWVAARSGKPYVVQVWGTDVELARRAPWFARHVLGGARFVIAASRDLADRARALGAHDVRVIPSGVDLPPQVGDEAEPPEILYAGRLSPEKGVRWNGFSEALSCAAVSAPPGASVPAPSFSGKGSPTRHSPPTPRLLGQWSREARAHHGHRRARRLVPGRVPARARLCGGRSGA